MNVSGFLKGMPGVEVCGFACLVRTVGFQHGVCMGQISWTKTHLRVAK